MIRVRASTRMGVRVKAQLQAKAMGEWRGEGASEVPVIDFCEVDGSVGALPHLLLQYDVLLPRRHDTLAQERWSTGRMRGG